MVYSPPLAVCFVATGVKFSISVYEKVINRVLELNKTTNKGCSLNILRLTRHGPKRFHRHLHRLYRLRTLRCMSFFLFLCASVCLTGRLIVSLSVLDLALFSTEKSEVAETERNDSFSMETKMSDVWDTESRKNPISRILIRDFRL